MTMAITPEQAKAVEKLAKSEPASAMVAKGVKKAARVIAAGQYAQLAHSLGLAPELWALDRDMESNLRRADGNAIYYGATLALVEMGARGGEMLEELVKQGASLRSQYLVCKEPGSESYATFVSDCDYTLGALARSHGEARAALLFKAALRAPGCAIERYLSAVASDYSRSVSGSSKTIKGILGEADKRAKQVAGMALACESEIRLAGSGASDKLRVSLEEMIQDAKERVALKSEASQSGVDPEEIKRGASKQSRDRLGALAEMIARCPEDAAFIDLMIDGSGCLKEAPLLSCVKFTSGNTLAGVALSSGSTHALRRLDEMGANLWLAAAQEGSANACEWAVAKMLAPTRGGSCVEVAVAARALLKGAWLNDASDPKAECLAMSAKMTNRMGSSLTTRFESLALALSAALEREVLGEASVVSGSSVAPKKRASL